MQRYFQVTGRVRNNDNYVEIVRDNHPLSMKLVYTKNDDIKVINSIKSFFTPRCQDFTLEEQEEEPEEEKPEKKTVKKRKREPQLYYYHNLSQNPIVLNGINYKPPATRSKVTSKKPPSEFRKPEVSLKEMSLEEEACKLDFMTTRLKKRFEFQGLQPLPHQQQFLEQIIVRIGGKDFFSSKKAQAFFLLFWVMGSGKSIGSLQLFSFVHIPTVYIICQNTMIEQWVLFIEQMPQPPNTRTYFHIIGLNEFGRIAGSNSLFLQYQYVIFDEAHMFRNVTELMEQQIFALQQAKMLFNLTGTPLVNSIEDLKPLAQIHGLKDFTEEEDEMFDNLLSGGGGQKDTSRLEAFVQKVFDKKVFFYDPKEETKKPEEEEEEHYPLFRVECKESAMTPNQVIDYMIQKKQNFTIGDVTITHGHRNAYHSAEKAMCNSRRHEQQEEEELSPKFKQIIDTVFEREFPQVVYSNFIDNGVGRLFVEMKKLAENKRISIECVTGKTPTSERIPLFQRYCAGEIDVLLLCKIGETGLNLLGTKTLHLTDSFENLQMERQTIGRVIRYNSKALSGEVVVVFKYLSTFPTKAHLLANKEALNNYFYERYCHSGLSSKEEYDLEHFTEMLIDKIQREENWLTIDQKLQISNKRKQDTLLPCIEMLQALGKKIMYHKE